MKIRFNKNFNNYLFGFKKSIIEVFGDTGKTIISLYLANMFRTDIFYIKNNDNPIVDKGIYVNNIYIPVELNILNISFIDEYINKSVFTTLLDNNINNFVLVIDDIPSLITQMIEKDNPNLLKKYNDVLDKSYYNNIYKKYLYKFINYVYNLYNLFNQQITIFIVNNNVGFLDDSFYGNIIKHLIHFRLNIKNIRKNIYGCFLYKNLLDTFSRQLLFEIKFEKF